MMHAQLLLQLLLRYVLWFFGGSTAIVFAAKFYLSFPSSRPLPSFMEPDAKKRTKFPGRPQAAKEMKKRGFSSQIVGVGRNNTARIHYKIFGNDDQKRKLVLCMGLGARGDLWQGILKRLVGEFQILVMDNRGVGESTAESSLRFGLYTIKMMAQDTLEVLDSVGWKNFNVVGHSMGGMVALELCLLCGSKSARSRSISRVRSLMLLNTHAGGYISLPSWYFILTKIKMILRPKILEFALPDNMQLMHGSDIIENPKEYRRIWGDKFHDKVIYGNNGFRSSSCMVRQLVAIAMHLVPEKDLLSLRSIPTMIVAGGEDNLISPENSRYLAKTLRGECGGWTRLSNGYMRYPLIIPFITIVMTVIVVIIIVIITTIAKACR